MWFLIHPPANHNGNTKENMGYFPKINQYKINIGFVQYIFNVSLRKKCKQNRFVYVLVVSLNLGKVEKTVR